MPTGNVWDINGYSIPCPSEYAWQVRRPLDVQGDNRPIYPGVRAMELRWELMGYEDWEVLQVLYNAIQYTGTAHVRIPGFPTATGTAFAFHDYSGVTLAEPAISTIFNQQYPTRAVLLIANIVTG